MADRMPVVSYLRLGAEPQLVAQGCTGCGALFLDRRNGCAACGTTTFTERPLARTGQLHSFTIVHRSAPGLPTPYVSAVVALDGGGMVKARLDQVEPDPEQLPPALRVRLTTFVAGVDDDGTEAIAFAFEPIGRGAVA